MKRSHEKNQTLRVASRSFVDRFCFWPPVQHAIAKMVNGKLAPDQPAGGNNWILWTALLW